MASYWKRIIFSDGCTVKFGHNFRVCECKKDGEGSHASDTNYAIFHQRLRCTTCYGQGYLKVLEVRINAEKYLEALEECIWPTVQRYFPDGRYIFQEDKAPTHKANLVKRYFQEKNTIPIPWPMCSPVLSPIDNCWSLVKMRLQKEIH